MDNDIKSILTMDGLVEYDNLIKDELKKSKADWLQNDETKSSYIKNRTHWCEPFGKETIPETTVMREPSTSRTDILSLKEGETYTVIWDGVSYNCVCKSYGSGYDEALYLGNINLLSPDTDVSSNEPFVIGFMTLFLMTSIISDETGQHTFSISGLIEDNTIEFDDSRVYSFKLNLEIGNTYKVTWNEKTYNLSPCSIQYSGYNCIALGNCYLVDESFENTNEPFCFLIIDAIGCSLLYTKEGEHTYSIDNLIPTRTINTVKDGNIIKITNDYKLVDGHMYKIIFDGIEYTKVCNDSAVGNYYYYSHSFFEDTGEPFLITNYGIHIDLDNKYHTFSVFEHKYHIIGNEYLPYIAGKQGEAEGSEIYNYDSNKASGRYSHAEGYETNTSGSYSHAEGASNEASGEYSHVEGYSNKASGLYSHAEGYGTISSSNAQHVEGSFNIEDKLGTYLHILGNGKYAAKRENAHTIDWNGVGWYKGGLKVGGQSQEDGSKNVLLDGDAIPIPSSARVGQTILVKSVDETGKPTEFESADVSSVSQKNNIRLIRTVSATEEEFPTSIVISQDADGNQFELQGLVIVLNGFGFNGGYISVTIDENDLYSPAIKAHPKGDGVARDNLIKLERLGDRVTCGYCVTDHNLLTAHNVKMDYNRDIKCISYINLHVGYNVAETNASVSIYGY